MGTSKLAIAGMGNRYMFICLYVWLEKYFSRGDYPKLAEHPECDKSAAGVSLRG